MMILWLGLNFVIVTEYDELNFKQRGNTSLPTRCLTDSPPPLHIWCFFSVQRMYEECFYVRSLAHYLSEQHIRCGWEPCLRHWNGAKWTSRGCCCHPYSPKTSRTAFWVSVRGCSTARIQIILTQGLKYVICCSYLPK
jgi:hypothetical protein